MAPLAISKGAKKSTQRHLPALLDKHDNSDKIQAQKHAVYEAPEEDHRRLQQFQRTSNLAAAAGGGEEEELVEEEAVSRANTGCTLLKGKV